MEADITYAELRFSQTSRQQQLPAPPSSNADTKKRFAWKVLGVVLLITCCVLIAAIVSQIINGYFLRMEIDEQLPTLEKLNRSVTHLQKKYMELWRRICDQRVTPECDDIMCPNEWKYFNGSCYFFSTDKRNWSSSANYCTRNESYLVVITSQQEQDFVKGGLDQHWIGMTDEEKEGTWQWVDGSGQFSEPEFWRKDEPNNLPSAQCQAENCATVNSLGWNDVCCDNDWKWICERKSIDFVAPR